MRSTPYVYVYVWGLAMLSLLSAGCQREALNYHYFEPLSREEWRSNHEIFFSTADLDPTQRYDVDLVLRLDREVKYKSLPLGIAFETPSRSITSRVITAPLTKEWQHLGGFTLYEQRVPLGRDIRFEKEGVYTYSVRHLSTDSIVKGVVEVGLTIYPSHK